MKTLLEIEQYAKENYIPIARKDFVLFFKDVIIKNNYHDILEIGSAIGYTSINLALMDNVYVTTIEKDYNRYLQCLENITDFALNDKINLLNEDALNIQINKNFDAIFIDAAKAKNILFFEKYCHNLKDNGVIIIDNMNMLDFKQHASLKKVIFYEQKIQELKDYLNNLKDYKVTYLDIGDGIAFIQRI